MVGANTFTVAAAGEKGSTEVLVTVGSIATGAGCVVLPAGVAARPTIVDLSALSGLTVGEVASGT